jgi:hypothetical protein
MCGSSIQVSRVLLRDENVLLTSNGSVLPRLQNPTTDSVYVSLVDLLQSLKLTVLGTSSTLYIWDMASETFFERGFSNDRKAVIMIDGKDEAVSAR